MNYLIVAFALSVIDNDIPNIFSETVRNRKKDQQKLAIEVDVKSLHQNQT